MKLKTLEPVVLNILEHNKIAREDDFILYGAVLKRFGIDLKISIAEFLATAKNNNMPTFEEQVENGLNTVIQLYESKIVKAYKEPTLKLLFNKLKVKYGDLKFWQN